MSHYVTVSTQYKDQGSLVAALEELFGAGKVLVHQTPVEINGWNGTKGEACHVVVPVSAQKDGLGDIGYRRNLDGTFSQFVDHVDSVKLVQLPQRYARAVTIKQARLSGYTVAEEKANDGTVRLSLSKWVSP